MSDLLRQQIVAMRESARAVVATADAILAAFGPSVEALRTPDLVTGAADVGTCLHPADVRIPAPRMGRASAWTCGDCGAEGDEV